MLESYAYGPTGARSAVVIFLRTESVITLADETKKNNDPNLEKTFDSKEQSKKRKRVARCHLFLS